MSKKRKKDVKKQVPAIFNTSQIFSQTEQNFIQSEQPLNHNKSKDEGMVVNEKGDLVWKRKKTKKKHHLRIHVSWGMLICLIFTLGLLALHIWIWDFVDDEGHTAIWGINGVFLMFFFISALKDDYTDELGFKKLVDVGCYSYSVEKEQEEPFKVKMPKDLGVEQVSSDILLEGKNGKKGKGEK